METATKRKRIPRRKLLATSNFNKVMTRLIIKTDLLIEENRKAQRELFPEPYKDWRTND